MSGSTNVRITSALGVPLAWALFVAPSLWDRTGSCCRPVVARCVCPPWMTPSAASSILMLPIDAPRDANRSAEVLNAGRRQRQASSRGTSLENASRVFPRCGGRDFFKGLLAIAICVLRRRATRGGMVKPLPSASSPGALDRTTRQPLLPAEQRRRCSEVRPEPANPQHNVSIECEVGQVELVAELVAQHGLLPRTPASNCSSTRAAAILL